MLKIRPIACDPNRRRHRKLQYRVMHAANQPERTSGKKLPKPFLPTLNVET